MVASVAALLSLLVASITVSHALIGASATAVGPSKVDVLLDWAKRNGATVRIRLLTAVVICNIMNIELLEHVHAPCASASGMSAKMCQLHRTYARLNLN